MSIDDSVRDAGTVPGPDHEPDPDVLRSRAVKALKKRRDFKGHLLVYLMANTFFVVIWLVTIAPDGFFWPVFPLVGWGIGVVMNAWDVYRPEEFSEDEIAAEMRRLEHRRH